MSERRERLPAASWTACSLVVVFAGLGCRELSKQPPTVQSHGAERVELAEATALVRARIFADQPDMNDAVEAPLVELTTEEMWRRLGVQLYAVTEGVAECRSFLVFGGRAHPLAGGFGGHGVQSACVTDLDGDGVAELTYSYSWGSGIHRSLLAVCVLDGEELFQQDARLAFAGDFFVWKESDAQVLVELGTYGDAFGVWRPEAPLGSVHVERVGRRLVPSIELVPLSEEHAKLVWIEEE